MISRQGYGEVASNVKVQSIPCPRWVREDNEKGINLVCHQPKYKLDITRIWVHCTPVRWNGLNDGCRLSAWQNWSKSCEWDGWFCGRDSKRVRNTSTPSVLTHLVKNTNISMFIHCRYKYWSHLWRYVCYCFLPRKKAITVLPTWAPLSNACCARLSFSTWKINSHISVYAC